MSFSENTWRDNRRVAFQTESPVLSRVTSEPCFPLSCLLSGEPRGQWRFGVVRGVRFVSCGSFVSEQRSERLRTVLNRHPCLLGDPPRDGAALAPFPALGGAGPPVFPLPAPCSHRLELVRTAWLCVQRGEFLPKTEEASELFSVAAEPVHVPASTHESSAVPTASPALSISCLLHSRRFNRCEVILGKKVLRWKKAFLSIPTY